MRFTTLYQKTNTGALQEWTISVNENVILTEWGQVGGAIQTTRDVIKYGKNVGRSNETARDEQARLEATSRWERRKKKGYVEDKKKAMAGEVDRDVIKGGIFPMLAHKYAKSSKKIKWPAYAQPKLDGHRCIVIARKGKVTLWSRKRKSIESVPHIVKAFQDDADYRDFIVDGELYNHDYRDNFEDLSSFITQQKPAPGHEVVQYHAYDMPSASGGFRKRHSDLSDLMRRCYRKDSPLRLVETMKVFDDNGLTCAFEYFLLKGYEGAMVRNAEGEYKQKGKSYNLQKVKKFVDDEFKVIGVKEGRGKLAGHAIFICRIRKDDTFDAKMKGPISELRKYWDDPDLAIGRLITVQYQGFTKKGFPRFPVALRFRAMHKGGIL